MSDKNTPVSMDDLSDFMEAAADLAESLMLDIKQNDDMKISQETMHALLEFADAAERLTNFVTTLQSSKNKLN